VDTWERKSQGLRRRRCYRRLNTVCRRLENWFRFRYLNFVDQGRERLWGLASENAEMTIQQRAQHNTENSDHCRPYQVDGTHPVPLGFDFPRAINSPSQEARQMLNYRRRLPSFDRYFAGSNFRSVGKPL